MSVSVLDQFTDTDGTGLASHTIAPTNTPSTSWSAPAILDGIGATPAMTITSNQVVTSGVGVSIVVSWVDSGTSNDTIAADITTESVAATGGNGFYVRVTDAANGWLCDMQTNGSGSLIIRENNSGSLTTRATQSASVPTSTLFTGVNVVLNGTSITFNGASTSVSYASSSFQSNTKHGISGTFAALGTGTKHDNFQIGVAPIVPGGHYYYRHLAGAA